MHANLATISTMRQIPSLRRIPDRPFHFLQKFLFLCGLGLLGAIPYLLAAAAQAGIKPLDGVKIEALETYQNPKQRQFDFGLGLWPLDPYYNGFSIDVGYTQIFNKTDAWEVVHADYLYTVDTGLTSQLADQYSVNPQSIRRLSLVLSSNFRYTLAYGKFIFFERSIRYFRSSILAGPAFVMTNQGETVGLGAGFRLETFVNNLYSWKLEVRDTYAFGYLDNNLAFIFGTSYGV